MILGMSLSTFVTVHVIISLIGIVAGIIVMFGLLGSNRMPGLTAIFLLFTILTNATGFLIPPLLTETLLPSHMIGVLSLVVLVIQSFLKVPALHALAPSVPPSEPPFAVVQGIVLVFFIIVIIGAVRRYRPTPTFA